MRFLVVLILVFTPVVVTGQEITFIWDANSEADLVGYRLYQSDTSGVYVFGPDSCVAAIPAGTETTTIAVPDGLHYWVLTAHDLNNESRPSNEVLLLVDTVGPAPPTSLAISF